MKKMLIFVIALILTAPLAAATSLDYYETVVDLDSKTSQFTFILLFEEAPTGIFEYPLSFPIKDFETTANFKNYTCEPASKPWGTLISCDFSKVTEGGRALNIKFTTPETIKIIEDKILFATSIKTPQEVKKMVVKTVLEKGYILVEEPEETTTLVPFSPKDGTEGSDGRRIFVEWIRENVGSGEGIDVSVTYEKIEPPTTGNQNMIFLFIGILILIITVLIGTRKGKEKKEIGMEILKEDEKRVMEILKENKGMCKQRVIVGETDFSKAKVSRLLKDLEERGLITTEKEGRNKKVYIKQKED